MLTDFPLFVVSEIHSSLWINLLTMWKTEGFHGFFLHTPLVELVFCGGKYLKKMQKPWDIKNYVSVETGNFIRYFSAKSWGIFLLVQKIGQPVSHFENIFVEFTQNSLPYVFFSPGNTETILFLQEALCKGKWKSAV